MDDQDGPGSDEEDGPNGPHSPFEQLEISLAWYWACVVMLGRWFLGLAGGGPGRGAGIATGSAGADDDWVWRERAFPRLRLPGGEEMPGSVPLAEWRGGEPEWGVQGE